MRQTDREKASAIISITLNFPVYGGYLDHIIDGWNAWFNDLMENPYDAERKYSNYDDIVKADIIDNYYTIHD